MVLVVVADVVGDGVQGAIVGVRLLLGVEGVVLRNEVARDGVHAAAHKAAGDEVEEGAPAHELHDGKVKGDARRGVDNVPDLRWEGAHEHGAERVEEELEDGPDL